MKRVEGRWMRLGLCGALAASISVALAQESPDVTEVVIVTGSLIRGSSEDTALPVDVISAEELEKSGTPSMVDVLKNLSISAGALGDTNQFAAGAQGTEGTGSVNLRNLGRQRTLVLLNGRRLVNAPQSGSPDTNLIPLAALGRVEVLKDGAAATYGSDAIGGVVNFITNDRLDGLELGGSYKYIEDTDGDYDTKVTYGWQGDNSSLIVAGGYQHRSELGHGP
jgi:iron complex outermembrane receptor protein